MRFKQLRLLIGINVFWLGLSMLFDGLNTLVLPGRLLQATGKDSATEVGLATFAGLLLSMLIQPAAGLLSDRLRPRWGRRVVIGGGLLLVLAGLVLFGLARHVLAIIAAYCLLQTAASVAQAAQQGLLPDLVPARWRGGASGLKSFMDIGGALLGFAVLGQLMGQEQTAAALAAIGAVLLFTFGLTLWLVREPAQPIMTPAGRVTPADIFRLDLRRRRSFAWLVLSRFLFLLGTYAVGRFLLLFVAERLDLQPAQAAEQAGALLAALALVTVMAAIPAGWLADRLGRGPLLWAGALLSAAGTALLIVARTDQHILLFGSLMALGSAAFSSANWALTADLAPPEEAARFLGLAHIGTAGAAAAAGLFGPLVEWANGQTDGYGYTLLFAAATLTFIASVLPLRAMANNLRQAQATPDAQQQPVPGWLHPDAAGNNDS